MKRNITFLYIFLFVVSHSKLLLAQPYQPPQPTELRNLTDSILKISDKPVKQLTLEMIIGYNKTTFTAKRTFDTFGNLVNSIEVLDSVKTIRTINNDPSDQKKTILTQTILPAGQIAKGQHKNRITWQQQVIEPKKGTTTTISRYPDSSADTSISVRNASGKMMYSQDVIHFPGTGTSRCWYYANGRLQKQLMVSPGKTETMLYDTTGEIISAEECYPGKKCITTMLRKKTDDESFVFYRIAGAGDTTEKTTSTFLNGKLKKEERIITEDGEQHTETDTYDYDYKTGNITSHYKIEDADTTEEELWLYDYPKKKAIYLSYDHSGDEYVMEITVSRTDTTRKGKVRTITEYEPLRIEKWEANGNPEELLSRFVPRHIHSADTTIGKPVYTAYTPADENRSYFDSIFYDKKNRLIRNANYVYERDEEHKKQLIAREIRTFKYAENSNSYTFRKTSLDPQYNWSSSRVYNGKLLISLDSTAMKTNFKENHSYDADGHLLRREHRELKENKLIRGWGETYSYTSTGQVLEHRAFTLETGGSEKTLWVIKNTWDGKLPLEQHITYGDGTTTRTFKCEYEFY